MAGGKRVGEIGNPELAEAAGGIDQQVAAGLQPREDVDGMQERRILHDQGVGLHDRLAQPDLAVGDAAEGGDRRAHALRAEARKGLGVLALVEGRHGEKLGGSHHALAAAAMQTNLEQGGNLHSPPICGSGQGLP
ncbi:MAG TPA: hypothetical protein PKA33_18720 [Amaricoccus sp.]|nr:hypothetical protein [Amaricoccus sp.]HMQ93594.1 hypothetical protein [Amaricoccus sp.]HMR54365.1 hypothetical protein [Amaricoccus sp.]HMU01378.1 hypothetical protein [Amaricoccus sp.]